MPDDSSAVAKNTETARPKLLELGLSPADAAREAANLVEYMPTSRVATRKQIEGAKRESGQYGTL